MTKASTDSDLESYLSYKQEQDTFSRTIASYKETEEATTELELLGAIKSIKKTREELAKLLSGKDKDYDVVKIWQ